MAVSSLPERILAVRESKKLSQEALGEIMGVSKQAVYNYEKGKREPSREDLDRLAEALGINRAWLHAGEGEMLAGQLNGNEAKEVASSHNRAMVRLPLVSVRASAGEGEEPFSEEIADYVSYDRDQLRRDFGADPSRLLVIPVVGDSMDPTLRAGERVLVMQYQGEPIYDGGVYVFHGRYRGVMVKRVRWQQDGSMLLAGDNPDVLNTIIIRPGEEEDWKVIGRVVRVEKNL